MLSGKGIQFKIVQSKKTGIFLGLIHTDSYWLIVYMYQ